MTLCYIHFATLNALNKKKHTQNFHVKILHRFIRCENFDGLVHTKQHESETWEIGFAEDKILLLSFGSHWREGNPYHWSE